MNGWRTVVVNRACKISLNDSCIVFDTDVQKEIPVSQIRQLIICSGASSITVGAMNMLAASNADVIICDSKHNPACELLSAGNNYSSSGNIIDQSKWKPEDKQEIWKHIVYDKIQSEIDILALLNISVPEGLYGCRDNICLNDMTNREGQSARLYFNAVFGSDFSRSAAGNPVNSALNYGYTIILSAVNRIVTMHGYHTALGIKHCNRSNHFNLSCDLMEPFRVYADEIAYRNLSRDLDYDYKKLFIELPQKQITFNNNVMSLYDAMEMYVIGILGKLSGHTGTKTEVTTIE